MGDARQNRPVYAELRSLAHFGFHTGLMGNCAYFTVSATAARTAGIQHIICYVT